MYNDNASLFLSSSGRKSRLSIETVKVAFFPGGVAILQILGVEVSTGGSTESNVRPFEEFVKKLMSSCPIFFVIRSKIKYDIFQSRRFFVLRLVANLWA
jgi:hypothetical protein